MKKTKTFKKKACSAFAILLLSSLLITSCGDEVVSENSNVESQISEENSSLSDEFVPILSNHAILKQRAYPIPL